MPVDDDPNRPWNPAEHGIHVVRTESGKRWHAYCDCGWNAKGRPQYRTSATEREAMLKAIWHARTPMRQKLKQQRVDGGSTTFGSQVIKQSPSGT